MKRSFWRMAFVVCMMPPRSTVGVEGGSKWNDEHRIKAQEQWRCKKKQDHNYSSSQQDIDGDAPGTESESGQSYSQMLGVLVSGCSMSSAALDLAQSMLMCVAALLYSKLPPPPFISSTTLKKRKIQFVYLKYRALSLPRYILNTPPTPPLKL